MDNDLYKLKIQLPSVQLLCCEKQGEAEETTKVPVIKEQKQKQNRSKVRFIGQNRNLGGK